MTSDVPPNFIKITEIYGFNDLGTSTRDVERNELLFLKQGDTMIDLGTYDEVAKKFRPRYGHRKRKRQNYIWNFT